MCETNQELKFSPIPISFTRGLIKFIFMSIAIYIALEVFSWLVGINLPSFRFEIFVTVISITVFLAIFQFKRPDTIIFTGNKISVFKGTTETLKREMFTKDIKEIELRHGITRNALFLIQVSFIVIFKLKNEASTCIHPLYVYIWNYSGINSQETVLQELFSFFHTYVPNFNEISINNRLRRGAIQIIICPNCAAEYLFSLNYCDRCGDEL